MDYSFERRRRRRPLLRATSSSREDDDIEQEIIERAMDIERTREKSMRRQLEFIVQNVKELERRRQERYRTRSPGYYMPRLSHSRHRSAADYRQQPSRWESDFGTSASERAFERGDSSYSEHAVRSPPRAQASSIACQITMVYRGNSARRHGDEIMVLQDNVIVFKGYLRPRESFTFKSKRRHRRSLLELDFYVNDLFEYHLSTSGEAGTKDHQRRDDLLFQIQNIRESKPSRRDQTTDEHLASGTDKSLSDDQIRSSPSRRRQHHRTPSPPIANGEEITTQHVDRHQHKSKSNKSQAAPSSSQVSKEQKGTTRQSSHSKQQTVRRPSPPPSSSTTRPSVTKSDKAKASSTQVGHPSTSRQTSSKTTSITEKKGNVMPSVQSDDDEKPLTGKKETNVTRPSYGPPQLSGFTRSSSDSSLETSKKEEKKSESPPAKKDENDEEEESGEGGGGGAGLNGFLQLLQAMSGGGSGRAQSGGDNDDDGVQGLLARLGIVSHSNSKRKSGNATPRQTGNVENNILVYLDSSTPDDSIVTRLRGLVNLLKIFDDTDDCVAFINSISDERVLLIVSDALGDPVVARIQDLQQLVGIYVRCDTEEQADLWSTNQPKIRGIFTAIDDLIQQMEQDIEKSEHDSLTFTHVVATPTNTKAEPPFVIAQLIKEILLDPDEMNEAKKELVEFCRLEYVDNRQELENIDQFEQKYQKENVVEFFQQQSFLSKMLNKGLRVPEVDILFKLRLFIQHLHSAIVFSSNDASLTKIYRRHSVTSDEFDTLKKCANGGLLAFSHFFSASTDRPDDEPISTSDDDNQEQHNERILFEIDVSNSNNYMLIDDQVLVTFGLVTRVGTIEKDEDGKRTIVHLTTISQDDRQLERALESMRKEIRAPHPALRVVKLFTELEEYGRAVQLGQALLADAPGARKDPLLALARTYHSLGTTLYEKEEYDQALDVLKKSHAIYIRFLPEDAPQLSPTWNNMGSIYLRQGKTELALEHHERALAIQLKSPSPDLPSIVSYSNNIGGVYLKLERYAEALVHFKRALQIEEQTLPPNHPELAGTYHRIGGVHFRQNDYQEALDCYDKTLAIELASLPDNHPTVAVTYHNRGTALEGLGRLEEAVESAEKAVERLLKTLPKEHPQVRMNQVYVDKLKQKLWVKGLFTS